MSCQPKKSNPNKFPIGTLGCGPPRTKFDIQQNKHFDKSNTPDYLGESVKENYASCACRKFPRRPHRTLSFDDTENPLSYNVQYHSMT